MKLVLVSIACLWLAAGCQQQLIPLRRRKSELGRKPQHIFGSPRPGHQPFLPPEHRLPLHSDRARQLGVRDPGPPDVFPQ